MRAAGCALSAFLIAGSCSTDPEPGTSQDPSLSAAEHEIALAIEEDRRISGRVVDEAGGPIPGAQVADLWAFEAGSTEPPFDAVTCDADGRFSGVFESFGAELWLVAYSDDRTRSGVCSRAVEPGSTSVAQVHIVARPSVRVRGRIPGPEPGAPGWKSLYWRWEPSGTTLVQFTSQSPEFDVLVPQGRWRWFAFGTDLESEGGDLVLGADPLELDLGDIQIETAVLAQLRGKPLPDWSVTAAHGVELDQSALAHYRGRWLLVVFWGAWCEACTSECLPRLGQFCEREASVRDRFEIVAFHDDSVKEAEAWDKAFADVRERHWGGRDLAFPVLCDTSGDTIRKYGIRTYPTMLLVDPDGVLVGEADENELLRRIRAEQAQKR